MSIQGISCLAVLLAAVIAGTLPTCARPENKHPESHLLLNVLMFSFRCVVEGLLEWTGGVEELTELTDAYVKRVLC